MKTTSSNVVTLALVFSLGLSACAGSSSAPAATPSDPSTAASAGSASPSSEPVAHNADAAAADQPAEGAIATPGATGKASRAARDVLELKDTIFFLNYTESDPGKAAETSCSKSAGKNPKAMNGCMAKAHQQMDDDGYRFEQDKAGTQWMFVIRRKGALLTTIHKVRYTYGAESESSVVVKPEGKDAGSKPWKSPPSELKFDVPTEYRIVAQDPKYGKLVYEAKSGIAGVK
jgi:hypothetical protein